MTLSLFIKLHTNRKHSINLDVKSHSHHNSNPNPNTD